MCETKSLKPLSICAKTPPDCEINNFTQSVQMFPTVIKWPLRTTVSVNTSIQQDHCVTYRQTGRPCVSVSFGRRQPGRATIDCQRIVLMGLNSRGQPGCATRRRTSWAVQRGHLLSWRQSLDGHRPQQPEALLNRCQLQSWTLTVWCKCDIGAVDICPCLSLSCNIHVCWSV